MVSYVDCGQTWKQKKRERERLIDYTLFLNSEDISTKAET